MGELDRLETVANAATEGPWIARHLGVRQIAGQARRCQTITSHESGSIGETILRHEARWPIRRADTTFISTFDPPQVKVMLTRIRELESSTLVPLPSVEALDRIIVAALGEAMPGPLFRLTPMILAQHLHEALKQGRQAQEAGE